MSDLASTRLIVLVVLTNLALLGLEPAAACIRIVALQGILLGLLPLLLPRGRPRPARRALLAAASIVLKGVVFPWLLPRALREADVRREVEPVRRLHAVAAGRACALLGVALWLGSPACRCPAPARRSSWSPVALFTIAGRALPDRQPGGRRSPGARLPRDGERHLRLRPGAVRGEHRCWSSWACSRRLRGRVRHGHHHLPHQPRVRPHRHRPAVDS